MRTHRNVPAIHDELRRTLLRLNSKAWGVAAGLTFGLGLFLATNVLVFKGGENPGPHLELLRAFFPGYRVTFVGSFVGFVYAFVVGYAVGRLISSVYNRLARSG